jgi:hypothetical protein
LPHASHLSRFRVFGVLAAARTKFVEAQPIFNVLFVFTGVVIAFFAIGTRQD